MNNGVCGRLALAVFAIGIAAEGTGAAAFAEDKPAPKTYEVETIRDQAYYEGADADPIKHKLDLYLPKDAKDYPVVLFIHGGAWVFGDKNHLGIYSAVGQCFARQGIGVVVANYRLSPKVQHPEHVKDVARAFAWTHKNIAKHGGRADRLFIAGHSAGGHLVALLGTDETYLKAESLALKNIQGVIPMSGIYLISDSFLPQVFGTDPEVKRRASPLQHVKPDLPPFCIMYADKDMPQCDKMSAAFCKALRDQKCLAETVEVKERNHLSIIMRFSRETDPAMEAAVAFINRQSGK